MVFSFFYLVLDKSKLENCIKACQVVVRCRGEAEKLHKDINIDLRYRVVWL